MLFCAFHCVVLCISLRCSVYFIVLFCAFHCVVLCISIVVLCVTLCCSVLFIVLFCAFQCVVLCVSLCCSVYFIVLFYVLFVCKCVLYYGHWVSTQLQLTNISYYIISYHNISYYKICKFYKLLSSYEIPKNCRCVELSSQATVKLALLTQVPVSSDLL